METHKITREEQKVKEKQEAFRHYATIALTLLLETEGIGPIEAAELALKIGEILTVHERKRIQHC